MKTVLILETDFGTYPAPPEFVEAQKHVRFRKRDTWPDMRFKAGRAWAKMFKEFSDEKMKEYLARG